MTIAAAMAAVSAGCATTTVYTPAAGEPTARLRLVSTLTPKYATDNRRVTHLWVRDLSACPAQPAIASTGNESEGRHAVSLHMPAPPNASSKFYTELLIPANKLLGIVVFETDAWGYSSCEVRTRIRPAAGVDYEVESRWNDDETKCFLDLRTLSADKRGVAQRQPFMPLDPDAYGMVAKTGVYVPVSRVIVVVGQTTTTPPDLCELPAR